MERNSQYITDRIGSLETQTRQALFGISALFVDDPEVLSVTSDQLQLFMLTALKYNEDLSAFFLTLVPNDDLILVTDLTASSQTHYASAPHKRLPTGTAYIVRIAQTSRKPNPEVWYYKNLDFDTIDTEKFPQKKFIVSSRPWYSGAIKTGGPYWTDVYHFIETNDPGITLSMPIYDDNYHLLGILGADLSFLGLSNFLKKQSIGKSGRAFIINENGKLLIPEALDITQEKISPAVVHAASDYYKKTNDNNFSFKINHTRYLCFVSELPPTFRKDWHIVNIVPFNEFFSYLIHTQFEIIFITLGVLLLCVFIIFYFSKRISKPIIRLAKEVDKITNLDLSSRKKVHSHIVEIRAMNSSVSALKSAIRSFSRYVPKGIVKQLLAKGRDIDLHVEKKELTILFSDIQDFTTIVETHSLNTLMPLLNEYLDSLSKLILDNQGTIDKYIGDSIMAFWGAPTDNQQHAFLACKATLMCHAFLKDFNQRCRQDNQPELITRFGISTGSVLVGNIGTAERMNYTVIGDTVNTAARLQVTDKIYHVNAIISEDTYQQVKNHFLVRPLDTTYVKGKKELIKIYELVALLEADEVIGATDLQRSLCEAFTQAYQYFIDGDYPNAKDSFEKIHQQFPDDYPTEIYLKRLQNQAS